MEEMRMLNTIPDCIRIASEGFEECDPFRITNTAELQIRLANAQARITVLEYLLREHRDTILAMVQNGATIPLRY
jgi:hypothetical protein